MRLLWSHLQEEPPDPYIGSDEAPPELVHALKTALRKDPEARPSSSLEYARSLSDAADQALAVTAG